MWGQKVLEVSAHSISSPRPTLRKKCPGTNEGNPNCQNVLPRATLSSAGQNHGRKKRHITREIGRASCREREGESECEGFRVGI